MNERLEKLEQDVQQLKELVDSLTDTLTLYTDHIATGSKNNGK